MCEMQYFLEYVLGQRSPSGQKADKGTICHKILEILAFIKLCNQKNEQTYTDDILGEISVKDYVLDDIIDRTYQHYTTNFKHHDWKDKDLKDCRLWVNKALSANGGLFDPRNLNILQPEQHFDIVIDKSWASYKYDTEEGVVEGQLAIKGTIDLLTRVNDSTIEIIDWKTGKRLDWATGQPKTFDKLQNDHQLRIYHYAVSMLYPEIEHIIVSINFINDGGHFSVCFDRSDLQKTEDMLRQKFETIKKTTRPKLSKSWKCSKLCHFGKNSFEGTAIQPIEEYRDGQVCKKGCCMTKCEQVKHDIDLSGYNQVVKDYTAKGYSVGSYKAPGSV